MRAIGRGREHAPNLLGAGLGIDALWWGGFLHAIPQQMANGLLPILRCSLPLWRRWKSRRGLKISRLLSFLTPLVTAKAVLLCAAIFCGFVHKFVYCRCDGLHH
eukprot:GHVR01104358.1.p1 GENE.GHVR01104358.1~~GHVR01104358.1.p1  ORF type:complete len:104 (+),score=0.44 GHVR01104358.1:60-371(+)